MMGSSSVVPPSSVVGVQYDPLLLSCSRKKQQTQRCASRDIILNRLRGPFQIRSHLHQLAHGTEPIGVCSISIRNGGLRCIGGCTCAMCPQNGGWTNRCSQLVTCRDSVRSLRSWNSNALGIGFSSGTRHASVRARAFNPQNGGDDGNSMGRTIFNLAGAGFLTYLTITGKLNWLFDAIFTFWLVSAVIWWFAGRSLIKGPCPNCGGEFQAFEFSLKDEPRLCPYCSQPFKLENKRFVREEPHFSNQQTSGFRQPFGGFGGFGGFEDVSRQKSRRNMEDTPGVIVDIEAEVRDKD